MSTRLAASDPWRYVTPCCERTTWRAFKEGFYCEHCGVTHDRLLDQKTGELA